LIRSLESSSRTHSTSRHSARTDDKYYLSSGHTRPPSTGSSSYSASTTFSPKGNVAQILREKGYRPSLFRARTTDCGASCHKLRRFLSWALDPRNKTSHKECGFRCLLLPCKCGLHPSIRIATGHRKRATIGCPEQEILQHREICD